MPISPAAYQALRRIVECAFEAVELLDQIETLRAYDSHGPRSYEFRTTLKSETTIPGAMEQDDSRAGENFIPVRHRQLFRLLTPWFRESHAQEDRFHRFCDRLLTIFHIEHLAQLIPMEETYELVDPDDESVALAESDFGQLDARVERLLDRLSDVLYSAHYHRLSISDLEEAIEMGCQWGIELDVNLDLFENLLVFARGYRLVEKKRRRLWNLFREETVQLPEFHRLVIAFRVKPHKKLEKTFRPNVVYLKMFKNIPEADLEVLLPGSTVRLSLFDRGKILLPTISGAAITAYKIFRGLMLLTLLTVTAIINWIVLIALLLGYIIRSVFGYFNTHNKYQLGLTQNLYLKNLDNNMGVIYRLFNEAEEQELCETLVVYAVLWRFNRAVSEAEVACEVVHVLKDFTGQTVNFDIHDALGKLARLELVEIDRGGLLKAVKIEDTEARLSHYWNQQLGKSRSLSQLENLFATD